MEQLYVGIRLEAGCVVAAVEATGTVRPLSPSLRCERYPTTQWEWGYGGTGPAELAWSIIHDATGDGTLAHKLHQLFKWQVIAGLPQSGWILTLNTVLNHLARIAAEDDAKEHDRIRAEVRAAEEHEVIDLGADNEDRGAV